MLQQINASTKPNGTVRQGLPPWAYNNDELTELEMELVFRRQWLFVGHVSQIAEPGDFLCLDEAGERAIVVRGEDGEIRGFHNLCRHRGSRIVDTDSGNAGRAITCPFHGWCYNLDGSLRGVPKIETFPGLEKSENGLKPLDIDIWHGLVFVRFKGSGPSVAELTAGIEDEISPYRLADMVPLDWHWREEYALNWKSVMDVDNEGYHVAVAHPGLNALFEEYGDDQITLKVNRAHGLVRETAGGAWSVRHYQNLLPKCRAAHLDAANENLWIYYGVFPNLVITVYPDGTADIYQTFPYKTRRAVMRGMGIALPGRTREARLLRYLKDRIDRETVAEDAQLVRWTDEAMHSSAFDGVLLSEAEAGVVAYHNSLREMMPVLSLPEPPTPGSMAQRNAEMRGTI